MKSKDTRTNPQTLYGDYLFFLNLRVFIKSRSYQTIVPHTRISSVLHTRRNSSERVCGTKYQTINSDCVVSHTLFECGETQLAPSNCHKAPPPRPTSTLEFGVAWEWYCVRLSGGFGRYIALNIARIVLGIHVCSCVLPTRSRARPEGAPQAG